jgi:hypothetical protein
MKGVGYGLAPFLVTGPCSVREVCAAFGSGPEQEPLSATFISA